MKPERKKLRNETEEQVSELQQQQLAADQQHGVEFESAEEMLRHDATQVQPPERIEKRLKESLANEPQPAQSSWWRRLFGG
jgi:hypothetical protein